MSDIYVDCDINMWICDIYTYVVVHVKIGKKTKNKKKFPALSRARMAGTRQR